MAEPKAPSLPSMPVDRPIRTDPPGTMNREIEFQGNARYGFVQGFGGETQVGAAKGNLPATWDTPRPLTGGGSPFKNRRRK